MENKTFKKILREYFKDIGYKSNKKCFYKDYGEIYLKFDLQKSNFSNGWYINYSIVIKELHPDEEVLDNWEHDASGRVIFNIDGGATDIALIELDDTKGIDSFKKDVYKGIADIVTVFEKGGLENYINTFPNLICIFSIWAQEYILEKEYIKEIKE